MKRWLVKIAVLLALGAIMNVAVAWSIALTVDLDLGFSEEFASASGSGYTSWFIKRHELSYAGRVTSQWFDEGWERWNGPTSSVSPHDLLFPWARVTDPNEHADSKAFHFAMAWEWGWPKRSIGGSTHSQTLPSGQQRLPIADTVSLHHCLALDPELLNYNFTLYSARIIGWRPLWPGFAINTIFYAAILWLLFAVPFQVRRWRRIKRGLCPACAYPVGASDVCTECGGKLPTRTHIAPDPPPPTRRGLIAARMR